MVCQVCFCSQIDEKVWELSKQPKQKKKQMASILYTKRSLLYRLYLQTFKLYFQLTNQHQE